MVYDISFLGISSNLSKRLHNLHIPGNWMAEDGKNILWLPPEYRPCCQAIRNGTVVLGHYSGRLSFLYFEQGSTFR
jgi:hypothetical protein